MNSTGDRRINYKIKNNLSFNQENSSQNILNLRLDTQKIKTIKEKNIKNQIIKYTISVVVDIKFNLINSKKIHNIKASKNGDYLVANVHASTLSNEKRLIDSLAENISDDIIKKISLVINDL